MKTRLCVPAGGGALALLCLLLAACASEPVSLDVRPVAVPTAAKVAAPVAFLHTKAFREDLRTVEPYGNQYYLPLKTGEASDRALRDAYARVFANAREVASLDEAKSAAPTPVVTLEPTIVGLDYLNASGRMWGPYYSEIVYRFALYDGTGTRVADWRVRGFGVYDMNLKPSDPGGPEAVSVLRSGEMAWMSEAPRRAVENGVAGFVAGFESLPELMRLARNLPLAGTNAPTTAQVTRPLATGVEAEYPGILSLQVALAAIPAPPGKLVKDELRTAPVLAVRITLRNIGPRRLALDPAVAQWLPQAMQGSLAEPISPLPGRVVSALLTGRPFGMTIGVMSPGVGMLPALFAALVSAAENERQKQELDAWTAAIERDLLVAGTVAPGASRSGVAYFPRPLKAEGGMLIVPVVDLDDAVRYTVRVPLRSQ